MPSMKNTPMGAAQSLGVGMGDQLQSQVEAELNERKKKLLSRAGLDPRNNPVGPATQSLYSMMNGGSNG